MSKMSNHTSTFGQSAPVALTLPRRPHTAGGRRGPDPRGPDSGVARPRAGPIPAWPRPRVAPTPRGRAGSAWPRPRAGARPAWPRPRASTVIIVLGPARLDHRSGTRRCVGDRSRSRFGDHLGRLTWAQPGEMRGTDPQWAEAGRLVRLRRSASPRLVVLRQVGSAGSDLPRVGALVPGCGGWESKITVVGPSLVDHRCGTRRCVSDRSRSRSGDHHERRTGSRGGSHPRSLESYPQSEPAPTPDPHDKPGFADESSQ